VGGNQDGFAGPMGSPSLQSDQDSLELVDGDVKCWRSEINVSVEIKMDLRDQWGPQVCRAIKMASSS
jgi:hypothetical protein